MFLRLLKSISNWRTTPPSEFVRIPLGVCPRLINWIQVLIISFICICNSNTYGQTQNRIADNITQLNSLQADQIHQQGRYQSELLDTEAKIKQIERDITALIDNRNKCQSLLDDSTDDSDRSFFQRKINEANLHIKELKSLKAQLAEKKSRIKSNIAHLKLEADTLETKNQVETSNLGLRQELAEKERCASIAEDIRREIKKITEMKTISVQGTQICRSGSPAECKKKINHTIENKALNEGGVAILESSIRIVNGDIEEEFLKEVLKAKIHYKRPQSVTDGRNTSEGFLLFEEDNAFGFKYSFKVDIQGIIDEQKYTAKRLSGSRCFKADAFRVIDSYPAKGAKDVDPGTSIEIEFSQPPDSNNMRSIHRAIQLKDRGRRLRCNIKVEGNSILLIPHKNLQFGREYKLTVKERLRDKRRQKLVEPFTMSFYTNHGGRVKKIPYLSNIEFAQVKGGCFKMGSNQRNAFTNESPELEVCVDSYYISRFEVTNKQWHDIMKLPHSYPADKAEYPVVNLTWHDVQMFLNTIMRLAPKDRDISFDIPSEVEWEFACKGGTLANNIYGTKNDQVIGVANYGLPDGGEYPADGFPQAAPVKRYRANVLGIYNLSGNVWEWTRDKYCPYIYDQTNNQYRRDDINPKDVENYYTQGYEFECGREGKRTIRGGSWFTGPDTLKCKAREGHDETEAIDDLGLRLVMYDFDELN